MQITTEEEQRYEELQLLALDFARNGETQDLAKMIEHGLSVNLSSHKADTLVMLSAYRGNYETTKMLLEKGANPDKLNARGQTPLHGVCFKGSLDIAKLLVEYGAAVDQKSLVFASMFGNTDILKYLQSKTQKRSNIFLHTLSYFTLSIRNLFFRKARLA